MNSFLHTYGRRDQWKHFNKNHWIKEVLRLIDQGVGKKKAKKTVNNTLWRIIRGVI